MFQEDDPRTYAIPAIRSLEQLKKFNVPKLTDPNAQSTLNEIKDHLEGTYDNVTYNEAIYGTEQSPNDRYLPSHHIPPNELNQFAEYNATYNTEKTEYGDRAHIELTLIVTTNGHKYAHASIKQKPLGRPTNIYGGDLTDFTATDAAIAATQAYGDTLNSMAADGLSGSEIIDNRILDLHRTAPENWAATRDVTYEAVRKNRESAREKLRNAGWPSELTEKPTDTVDDLYQQIRDEHGALIKELTAELITELPENKQTPDYKAALTVSLYETFAPGMHFGDMAVPDYELFLHRLGEMPVNAENHAKQVRLLETETDAMEINTFREVTNDIFHHLKDTHPTDTQLNEITE